MVGVLWYASFVVWAMASALTWGVDWLQRVWVVVFVVVSGVVMICVGEGSVVACQTIVFDCCYLQSSCSFKNA